MLNNFIVKSLFIFYHHHTHAYAFHIKSTTLASRTYELVPEYESEQRGALINLTKAVEDPNQSSEEPNASYAQEGKPQSMNPTTFNYMQFMFHIYLCI